MVTTSRDVSRAARALKRAVQCALNASAINVVDLEAQPLPVARFQTARSVCSGGVALRTTSGDPQSIDIVFLTSAARNCPRRPRASWNGFSPGRSTGGPSPARSPSSPTHPGSSSPTPRNWRAAST